MAMASHPGSDLHAVGVTARAVLYAGPVGPAVEAVLRAGGKPFDLHCAASASAALLMAAKTRYDVAIIDQRERQDALTLLIAALAGGRWRPPVVVLAAPGEVSQFLRCPGVHSVITSPADGEQLRKAVWHEHRNAAAAPSAAAAHEPVLTAPARAAELKRSPGVRRRLLSTAPLMGVVSTLYKNAALVLLATLFAAFSFYGLLIAFFLLSPNWAAPMTLSKGHEVVARVEQEISSLQVNLNLADQRYSEAVLEAGTARRAHDDARLMVEYVRSTTEQEISARRAERKSLRDNIKRLGRTHATFEKQIKSGGMERELAELYYQRLIDKKTFQAGTLGLLEAGQRLAVIEGELDAARDAEAELSAAIDMLTSLASQLDWGPMSGITGASASMLLLAKQAVDARSGLDQAKQQLDSVQKRQAILDHSRSIMRSRIADLKQSPLGRAAAARVDVIFVPYGNQMSFEPGVPLYSCALTVFFCHRAGTVATAVPGESTAVHPFFGKPLRGFFVEVQLDDPKAASREIIHAGRAPFFF